MQATLREVSVWCGSSSFPKAQEAGDMTASGVSTDTRTLKPGQLFVPLVGERFDGHDHLAAAEAAGAVAALWREDRPPSSTKLPLILVNDTLEALQRLAEAYLDRLGAKVVGVTGSNGKTTTKDLIASVLSTAYKVVKTEGNFNNHIGLPLTILRAPADAEVLVLEMGMSGFGEISLLTKLAKPQVAVITNIGESHLLQLGSRRNIARAKLEIAEGLREGGALIYNGDEPLLAEELAASPVRGDIEKITFGAGEPCDVRLGEARPTEQGGEFYVADEPDFLYSIPVPGRHNALNSLAAIAAGKLLGLSRESVAKGLATAPMTGMRIERSKAWNGADLLNDAYNASPTSVRAAIDLVASLEPEGKRWVVLGDMLELGPDEAEFHAGIGRYLNGGKAEAVLAYGPLSKRIAEEAAQGFPAGAVKHYDDKDQLIADLIAQLKPEDLVLVKASRGMKLEQVVSALHKGVVG
ncbi:UDP-N-acetylmuramoyl-tripeptide--D-alanyl-D-alanine ligase [Cohnella thailandensis]|uniref:UDP-N-acetylmuramoyl-tripeptide--D-alanyl-D-alanine ligase n=1 Tax=Cohnella thailandensis TaxID=557557 RepID=A0A841SWK7_9BACL|nr:UDP-N-acetylmuramoyl-tripeptide--D-alanyl-D-alanine ligase [Cohnella thailandensis]MBB6636304.1 UDP-N-acetylmuramoyl-tripeptide--D-alanyl-D-alanine ligase [Cohnella thailandensis]MBP1973727.1 UDP-N-acetylmuramoyl-tripeptide--D-alanyl-D-alanine ligase [Cohnella thailandensis]